MTLRFTRAAEQHGIKLEIVKPHGRQFRQPTHHNFITGASGTVLASGDMHAHNTFEQPNNVTSGPLQVTVGAATLNVTIPAGSVSRIDITLD